MSSPRPRSWYAVSQPYTYQSPGQQAPLAPGAPDFPPVSAAPPASPSKPRYATVTAERGTPYHHAPQDTSAGQQMSYGLPRYENAPLATSQNNGPPAHAAAMALQWTPGHQTRHSQPILPTHGSGPYPTLTSPQVDVPTRSKSPKLGGHEASQPRQNSAGPLYDPSEISRIRSPQPRRNTVPSPILPSTADPSPNLPSIARTATPAGRRPLPAPPRQYIPAIPNGKPAPPSSSVQAVLPSTQLSRSPSAASSTSVSSAGSIRRRPLPQPPGIPQVEEPEAYVSPTANRPASYAEAQAAVSGNTFPSHRYPGYTPHPSSVPQEEPAHVQNVRARIEQMTVKARRKADENGCNGTETPASNSTPAAPPSINVPTINMPSANVPSFAFDEPDEPSSSAAPAISISVAPPSPSLKATTSNYFESQLEDEHVPLPSSSVPMATSTRAHATACPKCARPVLYGRTVNAMGKRWHPDCFVCEQCETKLEHMEFFTKDGRPYCHVDYHELFSIRCNHCKTPIVDESYITIDDTVLGKRQYHELHFFCANCGDPFLDPKGHGPQSADPELAAKPFTVHNGHPYCENCNLRLHRPKCNHCKKPIPGDVLKALNKDWCEDCFVCEVCRKPFADGTFVVHQGKPHCELCLKRILIAAATVN